MCEGVTNREQINMLTPWIDGGTVYSSTEGAMKQLRAFIGGRLRVGQNNTMPTRPPGSKCMIPKEDQSKDCFLAGTYELFFLLCYLWFQQYLCFASKTSVMKCSCFTHVHILSRNSIDYNVEDNDNLVISLIMIFDNSLFRAFFPEAITYL